MPVIGTMTTKSVMADERSNAQTIVISPSKTTDDSVRLSNTSEQLIDLIRAHSKITKSGGVTTLSISDEDLELAINKSYGPLFASSFAKRKKVAGVTRVKNYKHGNIDIYLSKNTLNSIRRSSLSAVVNLFFGLIGAATGAETGGASIAVIRSLASKLAGAMLSQVGEYKVGRVYKIRKWKYAGWRYQYK